MNDVFLFKVADAFQLTNGDLIIGPDRPVPLYKAFRSFQDEITVVDPAGEQRDLRANFLLGFDIRDVIVSLPGVTKASVPIGCEIWGSAAVYSRLFPQS